MGIELTWIPLLSYLSQLPKVWTHPGILTWTPTVSSWVIQNKFTKSQRVSNSVPNGIPEQGYRTRWKEVLLRLILRAREKDPQIDTSGINIIGFLNIALTQQGEILWPWAPQRRSRHKNTKQSRLRMNRALLLPSSIGQSKVLSP